MQTLETVASEKAQKFPCLVPTLENLSRGNTLLQVLDSHTWQVDRLESQAKGDEIFVKIHCSLCGLEKVFIISNILENGKTKHANK